MAYAQATTVTVEKSKQEIEAILRRYGADSFASGWDEAGGSVGFRIKGLAVRLFLPIPRLDSFARDRRGSVRTPRQRQTAQEAEERRRWRALALVVKAKLEAVETGISSIEREFLADVVLPNGETVDRFMVPQIEAAYKSGRMPTGISGLLAAPATFEEAP